MTSPSMSPTVAVTAHAQREVPPDSFVLTGRVSTRGEDSAAAMRELATRYRELEAAVAALASSFEIRHESINNWPEGGRRQIWHANRAITLTGNDLSTVAAAAAALASVPDVALEGPLWRVDRDNPAHAELQAEAVQEARARAERYAAALGGVLGRLVELSDPGAGGGMLYRMSAHALASGGGEAMDIASVDLSPQPIEISASVNATWYLVLPD
jgi:uncharacterized protein YggE